MYISSDGTRKDTKDMPTDYLINALAKSLREIYSSKNQEEYNKHIANQEFLSLELNKRMDEFLSKKIDSKEWE